VSTGTLAAGEAPGQDDDGIPFGVRLQQLAEQRGGEAALDTLAPDGTARKLTFAQLDARANQWGRALEADGVKCGSLVSLAIPNSEGLVLAALGCWKIGAVPVPMRWDLPDWERSRVLEVIDPAVIVDEQTRDTLTSRAADQSQDPLPAVVSPNANGICSSGSTGLPKVILTLAQGVWTPESSLPFLAAWAPTAQPQTILVPGPMYHTNGFSPLSYLLGGDRLVVLEKFNAATVVDAIEQYRITNW
jgi:bile acid-coenzyme A ligase